MARPTVADQLATNARPVIADLWAPWCDPCRRVAPVVEHLEAEYTGRVDVRKVHAEEQPDVARELRVIGIPAIIAFNAGREIARKVGTASEADLQAILEAALHGEKPARRSIPPFDRALPLTAGAAILILALGLGPSIPLLVMGGVVLFTGVVNRCPIWQAIRPPIASLIRRGDAPPS
jgi:thioredoxin